MPDARLLTPREIQGLDAAEEITRLQILRATNLAKKMAADGVADPAVVVQMLQVVAANYQTLMAREDRRT